MPGAYYVDEDLLKLELRHVFGGDWICIGRADEIPAPGNFMAYDLLGEPVAIIRGSDEVIRALSNVCRHRGCRSCPASAARDGSCVRIMPGPMIFQAS